MEHTIRILEDTLRACIIDFNGNWHKHFLLMEFAYNNSFLSSIYMALYEDLYGRRCRSSIGWFEVCEASLLCPKLIYKTLEKVHIIRNWLQTPYSRQKSCVDHRRRDLEFEEGHKVYFKISPLKGLVRFGKKGKLIPRYVVLVKYCKGLVRFIRFSMFPCLKSVLVTPSLFFLLRVLVSRITSPMRKFRFKFSIGKSRC